ncbi:vegetative cell wall protein gp1-like [Zerene cesonia]|uniref:vegetative cell wall protein gp1-like n=1 Tax=Zerene cesonia TaxID=33412 RepID=UPI0018E4E3B8|nr:vegetative cell wall protein gp1-like [Zerene cesonia]
MKLCAFVLLLVFCYVHCRKTYAPIDKNANIAFINMEAGGGPPPNSNRTPPSPQKSPSPVVSAPQPTPPSPTTTKPVSPSIQQAPVPATLAPSPLPNQIKPKPVNPSPAVKPITTPGPGTVKQLVNFYDSQGKASPIRPYSYSQAVKQG